MVYIEYYHKKLEHFTNITYSSKSIWQETNDNISKKLDELIQPGQSFNKHAKFTLIEQINNTIITDTDTIK